MTHLFNNEELASHDAKIRADAWDEGFSRGLSKNRRDLRPPNPYRAVTVSNDD